MPDFAPRLRCLSAALLPLLAACQPAGPEGARPAAGPGVLMQADFEQSIGWGSADVVSLTTEQAHSGRWGLRVAPEVPFGYTYSRPLGELSATPLRELQLEGWVRRPAPGSTARLVVQVDSSASSEVKVFYLAYPLEKAVPDLNKWTRVQIPLTLPTSAKGSNQLKIYLWNEQATAPTFLDDLTLRRRPD